MHDVLAADEIGDNALYLEQARACLRRLELDFKKRQVDQLRERIKVAEREGHFQEALKLLGELSRLEKEIDGGGGG